MEMLLGFFAGALTVAVSAWWWVGHEDARLTDDHDVPPGHLRCHVCGMLHETTDALVETSRAHAFAEMASSVRERIEHVRHASPNGERVVTGLELAEGIAVAFHEDARKRHFNILKGE